MTFGFRSVSRWVVAGLAVAVVLLGVRLFSTGAHAFASPPDDPAQKKAALPPLQADEDEPLLLDQTTQPGVEKNKKRGADNSACHVCHVNYKSESFAVKHANNGVGCIDCHGASEAHRNDENNITPPQVMFPLATLDNACRECHTSHNVPARSVVDRFLKRKDQVTDLSKLVCTDCHGQHRLARRTVRWDRETGKLLSSETAQAKP